ncbi:unnamed protein product [Paramecium pentaurelia]|uniref:Uncharacterized protein n=1 Tax=Paramecium pentaurelia TaxID=43138 RepID=A0A8S1U5C0_9CILI|nr:unnamed protein product [Paramecium pentaurelia]
MFNSYQYDKQLAFTKEIDKIKKDYLKQRENRKELNQRLSKNYKKRIENFVINMLENPIVCNEYKPPEAYQFRDEDPTKNLGDPQIYVKGFKHEKDRIQEAQEKNNNLDFLPNLKVGKYCFRERDPSKDIKRDVFRYRDKTALARIEQFLKDHTQSQVENMKLDHKKILNLEHFSEGMSSLERKAYLSRLIAKNLLPSLHNKTHFQAAQTMYNNLPLTLMEHARSLPQVHTQEDSRRKPPTSQEKQKTIPNDNLNKQDDNGTQPKQGNETETFNPVETSKQILKKCNIIKERNIKAPVVHSGSGHLISTLDKSISEIYKELYKVEIGQSKLR